MAAEPITAVANALERAGQLVQPFINEAIAQKHNEAFANRIREYSRVCAIADPRGRADALNGFVLRLLADNGKACRGVGEYISVPVDVLDTFIEITGESIRDKALMASMEFKRK